MAFFVLFYDIFFEYVFDRTKKRYYNVLKRKECVAHERHVSLKPQLFRGADRA